MVGHIKFTDNDAGPLFAAAGGNSIQPFITAPNQPQRAIWLRIQQGQGLAEAGAGSGDYDRSDQLSHCFVGLSL